MITDSTHQDSSLALWRSARESADMADAATLERAAGCLAVALAEMVVSARTPQHFTAAEALAGAPGPCTVSSLTGRAALTGAVTANAYLMHARLTDDSFRVAAHPGLAVVPVALAAAEHTSGHGAVDGVRLLRAVVGGYECACQLAERLLPAVSRRGWRVTSVIAPLAAAATTALVLGLPDEVASAALGLASAAAGGPLGVVSTNGDGWRLQPALAVQAGVSATVASIAGLRGGADALGGAHGLYALFGGDDVEQPQPFGQAAVHRVTFKRYPVAMYGQSIFDAIRALPPIEGSVRRITVRLAPFAAGYGGNQRAVSTDSISSVEGITAAALRTFQPGLAKDFSASQGLVEVLGDPALPELTAQMHLEVTDGRLFELTGNGDTSSWGIADFSRHCQERLGDVGTRLYEATTTLTEEAGVARLFEVWRAAR
ncbi:MmgE/PrpD family protein [Amycolatopsis alkalitolerans]|uniref:MmgE/PrpD family protein n=1 Tax=Amycolatopsis alkalitolerans TaxID=2547244 RepID=A0A5C4M922_9PSEU|nr:MmgE/PrpD family protein [Amycolatopsis alkalitolerans]TNC29454.1 MmgE/PrpD family protein [Amycolatopsis alkalitolerans]